MTTAESDETMGLSRSGAGISCVSESPTMTMPHPNARIVLNESRKPDTRADCPVCALDARQQAQSGSCERTADVLDWRALALRRRTDEHHHSVQRMSPEVVGGPPAGVFRFGTRGDHDRSLYAVPAFRVADVAAGGVLGQHPLSEPVDLESISPTRSAREVRVGRKVHEHRGRMGGAICVKRAEHVGDVVDGATCDQRVEHDRPDLVITRLAACGHGATIDISVAWARMVTECGPTAASRNDGVDAHSPSGYPDIMSVIVVPDALPQEPLAALRVLTDSEHELERIRREQVIAARSAGASWQQIGDALGVTRQSAWESFTATTREALASNVDSNSTLDEDDALELAVEEVRAVRRRATS